MGTSRISSLRICVAVSFRVLRGRLAQGTGGSCFWNWLKTCWHYLEKKETMILQNRKTRPGASGGEWEQSSHPTAGGRGSVTGAREDRDGAAHYRSGERNPNAVWTEGLNTSLPQHQTSLSLETALSLSGQLASLWFRFMVMTDMQWKHRLCLGTVGLRVSRTTTTPQTKKSKIVSRKNLLEY